MPQLAAVLLRFRLFRIAVTADMEEALHQIGIHPKDRDVLRFLWINPKTKDLIIFRWCVVPFGVNSSPLLLAATVNHQLKKYQLEHPEVVKILSNNLYEI